MQTLLLPAARSGIAPPYTAAINKPIPFKASHHSFRFHAFPYSSLSSFKFHQSLSSPFMILNNRSTRIIKTLASSPITAAYSSPTDESEKAKLSQVSKRLEKTSRYFKRLGSFGFWAQLVCTIVAAVILSFSVVVTGKITSPPTFYATVGSIAAALISVFWSFGYIRLSERLKRTANDPSKTPPRADVVNSLKNGIGLNVLGIGAAILGMQATVGLLVAKALTTSATPNYQGTSGSPVLALDVSWCRPLQTPYCHIFSGWCARWSCCARLPCQLQKVFLFPELHNFDELFGEKHLEMGFTQSMGCLKMYDWNPV